jgi:hypothetical protein
MTIAERAELYDRLYKSCKAVEAVSLILGKFDGATPLERLDLLRECVSRLVSKDCYDCYAPTVTSWVRCSNYVAQTYEIYVAEPDIKAFLEMFRFHLQRIARDPKREDVLIEGNEGITKRILFTEAEHTLEGWDDAQAWAQMVLDRASKI